MKDFLPIVRVEIEGVKHQVAHYFRDFNLEIEKAVKAQIDAALSEEALKHVIALAVEQELRQAISRLASEYIRSGLSHPRMRRLFAEEVRKQLKKDFK